MTFNESETWELPLPEEYETISATPAESPRNSLAVRPYRDNGGIEAMDGLLDALHEIRTGRRGLLRRRENIAEPQSFEIRYGPRPNSTAGGGESRVVGIEYVPPEDQFDATERQLEESYPNSQIQRASGELIPGLTDPATEGEMHLAASTLGLTRYDLFPIKNKDLPGFDTDPIGSVIKEMVGTKRSGEADADVSVQVLFRPAQRGWWRGIDGGPSTKQLAESLRADKIEKSPMILGFLPCWRWIPYVGYEYIEVPASKAEKRVANTLTELTGHGWEFRIRVVAASHSPEVAKRRCANVAGMFSKYYELYSEQTFLPYPIARRDLPGFIESVRTRSWDAPGEARAMRKSQAEVAGLVNIPRSDDVTASEVTWALTKAGKPVPPGTPRFDFEAHGVSPDASKEEKQIALLDASGPGSPHWYGLGARHGTEAGIDIANLTNGHKFIHGESGTGKTTGLAGDISQDLTRPGGGLRLDPTGDDTEAWLAEWPDSRSAEELIYMDLSGEHERIPRFNFLEIPDYLEPDSWKHTEFLEKMAETILAMIGEAGGSDNYVGGLMKRVLKTVVRAMARFDEPATLYDVAVVCSSSENLARFAEQMDPERYEHLRDRAETLSERSDTDLDALAGRLDEWVLNDNVRELICAREPTFSIHEAVKEGRQIFVKFSDSGSDTVKHMVGTALISRTYHAQRFHRPDHPFSLTGDECQSLISSASEIETIMDQGRKFDYRVTLACQRPQSQLPDGVRNAVLGNARTIISFASGREFEARAVIDQHDGIELSDLVHLNPYQFYVRTETDQNETTYSYKVDAFRAPAEAREMVDSEPPVDVDELTDASLDIYGATQEEVGKAQSAFSGSAPAVSDEQGTGLDPRGEAGTLARKAVFDQSIHTHGDGHEAVDVNAARERFARYMNTDVARSSFGSLCEHADYISLKTADGKERIHVSENGLDFLSSGSAGSAGSIAHRGLLHDTYVWLTRLGLEVEIPEQTGDRDVDAVGLLRETLDLSDVQKPKAIRDALNQFEADHPVLEWLTDGGDVSVEAESSTSTKPAQTARNLVKAYEADERCIFAVREDKADRVLGALTDPPFAASEDLDGTLRLYNGGDFSLMNGEIPLRPSGARSTVWEQLPDGSLRCSDSNENVIAEFDSIKAARSPANSDEWPNVVTPDEDVSDAWTTIKEPFVPKAAFGGELPDSDDWTVLVIPDSDTDEQPEEALTVVTPSGWKTLGEAAGEGDDGEEIDDEKKQELRDALAELRD